MRRGVVRSTISPEVDGDEIEEYTLTPGNLGLKRYDIEEIAGGQPEVAVVRFVTTCECPVTPPSRRKNKKDTVCVARVT